MQQAKVSVQELSRLKHDMDKVKCSAVSALREAIAHAEQAKRNYERLSCIVDKVHTELVELLSNMIIKEEAGCAGDTK